MRSRGSVLFLAFVLIIVVAVSYVYTSKYWTPKPVWTNTNIINNNSSNSSNNSNSSNSNNSNNIGTWQRYITNDLSRDKPKIRRLGNLMFSYASLLGIARETDSLPILQEDIDIFKYFESLHVKSVGNPKQIIQKNFTELKRPKGYSHYSELVPEIRKTKINVQLYGYFLAWKYFKVVSDTVRSDFKFKEHILSQAQDALKQLAPVDVKETNIRNVGIHIRRGDITEVAKQNFGYALPGKLYFEKAMKYFKTKHKHVRFIVCTDDMKWAKENVKADNLTFSDRKEAVVDMAILSLCDDVIMSVGTFGWWAGWLSGGEVVYYSKWVKPGTTLDKERSGREDHFPPEWIAMDEK